MVVVGEGGRNREYLFVVKSMMAFVYHIFEAYRIETNLESFFNNTQTFRRIIPDDWADARSSEIIERTKWHYPFKSCICQFTQFTAES